MIVQGADPLRAVIATIESNACGLALVVDPAGRLVNTITDGDVRRALLNGLDLDRPASDLKPLRSAPLSEPVTAPVGTPQGDLLALMKEHGVQAVPLVDSDGRLQGLISLRDMIGELQLPPLRAVVMAGGFGRRLAPLTQDVPKPMLPIGDRPLLEHTIERLREAGVKSVCLTTHYKGEVIQGHFGDGSDFGVKIQYLQEDDPLGTAGALGLIEQEIPMGPLLVLNGDILTQLDYQAMLSFHQEYSSDLTVAVRRYDLDVPYGVVQTDGVHVERIVEKPTISHFVNAGVYLLEPSVLDLVPPQEHLDMPDLVERALANQLTVVSFPVREYWLDIGHLADYRAAQADAEAGRL